MYFIINLQHSVVVDQDQNVMKMLTVSEMVVGNSAAAKEDFMEMVSQSVKVGLDLLLYCIYSCFWPSNLI